MEGLEVSQRQARYCHWEGAEKGDCVLDPVKEDIAVLKGWKHCGQCEGWNGAVCSVAEHKVVDVGPHQGPELWLGWVRVAKPG